MFEKNNYHSGTTIEREYKTNNSIPQIIKSNTARVKSFLIDTSDISEASFNYDSNDALYSVYPAIADELEKTMSKEKPIRLGVETEDEEKIESLVALKFDFEGMKNAGLNISGTERLNSFDRTILDAITSLCADGFNKYLSTNMIFRVLNGGNSKIASANYTKEINNSIIKLMFSHIIIRDWNNELNDFRLLSANFTRAKLNGYETDCIHILRKLSLYVYADCKNQIHEIDSELVRKPFKDGKRESKAKMNVLFCLLRKIIAFKKMNTRIASSTFLYETIYHELGYENATKINKFKLRQRIKAILDAWKGSTLGDIKLNDYKENKKSSMPYEIELTYSKCTRKKNISISTKKRNTSNNLHITQTKI